MSLSPYVLDRLEVYTGEGKKFSTVSDAVNTALIEMFHRFELRELAEAVKIEEDIFKREKREEKQEKKR